MLFRSQTVPPPAHSHYTHASVHAYSNFPTGTASQAYLNVPVLSTATVTTSAASRPHVHYDPQRSVVGQALRDPALASAVQSAAATAADVPKPESVVATYAPVASVIIV